MKDTTTTIDDELKVPTLEDLLKDFYKAIDKQADKYIAQINQNRVNQKIEVRRHLEARGLDQTLKAIEGDI